MEVCGFVHFWNEFDFVCLKFEFVERNSLIKKNTEEETFPEKFIFYRMIAFAMQQEYKHKTEILLRKKVLSTIYIRI